MNNRKILATMIAALCAAASASAQNLVISKDASSTSDDCPVTLRANSTVEYTVDGVKVEVDDADSACLAQAGGSGAGVTLDVQPFNEVASGTDVTLSWNVPSEHTCSLRKGAQTLLNDGQIDANLANSATNTVTANATYTMSCAYTKTTGAAGTENASATAQVTVAGGDPDPGGGGTGELCSNITATNFTRTTQVEYIFNNDRFNPKSGSTYEEVFGTWGAGSGTIHMSLGKLNYASLSFTVPQSTDGFASLTWDQLDGNADQIRVSVSQCIGPPESQNAIDAERCYVQANGRSGGFTMKAQNSPVGCVLEKGKTYFLNVAYMNENGTSGCQSTTNCKWNVVEQ